VPVISFGENELYRRHTCFNLIPNGIPWGRFIIGHIPLRRPLVTVGKTYRSFLFYITVISVGKPIHVTQIVDPTSADIDKLHHEYLQAVKELYEVNRNRYGLGHVKLEII
jgi:hypothetical protein